MNLEAATALALTRTLDLYREAAARAVDASLPSAARGLAVARGLGIREALGMIVQALLAVRSKALDDILARKVVEPADPLIEFVDAVAKRYAGMA